MIDFRGYCRCQRWDIIAVGGARACMASIFGLLLEGVHFSFLPCVMVAMCAAWSLKLYSHQVSHQCLRGASNPHYLGVRHWLALAGTLACRHLLICVALRLLRNVDGI